MSALDLRGGKLANSFQDIAGSVRCIRCHPSEPLTVSCGLDRFLRVHHLHTKKLLHKVCPPQLSHYPSQPLLLTKSSLVVTAELFPSPTPPCLSPTPPPHLPPPPLCLQEYLRLEMNCLLLSNSGGNSKDEMVQFPVSPVHDMCVSDHVCYCVWPYRAVQVSKLKASQSNQGYMKVVLTVRRRRRRTLFGVGCRLSRNNLPRKLRREPICQLIMVRVYGMYGCRAHWLEEKLRVFGVIM